MCIVVENIVHSFKHTLSGIDKAVKDESAAHPFAAVVDGYVVFEDPVKVFMTKQYAALVVVRVIVLPDGRAAAAPIGIECLPVTVYIRCIGDLVELIKRAFRCARR